MRHVAALLLAATAIAEPAPVPTPEPEPESAPAPEPEVSETYVVPPPRETSRGAAPGRASSQVTRRDLEERLPRSAPDALRYEPGVYVQQTAHGQGSAFIRGRTGQQTVILFDGIRLNNSLYRQGPNQYFFTIDSRTIESIEVLRGGASTRWGSDAIAGAILARPIEPLVLPPTFMPVRPSAQARAATADGEIGGRIQLEAQARGRVAALAGAGARRAGLLEGGGVVTGLEGDAPPMVPRLADDGRTQLGTGFEEIAADGRVAIDLGARRRLVLAVYDYRQLDTPRTDQCPAPFAPIDECLTYDEQFRTLAYAALEGGLGAAARDGRLTLSWQRQHERRTRSRPDSFTEHGWRDDADTFGVTGVAETATARLTPWAGLTAEWGGDLYHDRVDSTAWLIFSDVEPEFVDVYSRGQYLAGSTYTYGGGFADLALALGRAVTVRAGGRLAIADANSPADPDSGTRGIDRSWRALVGHSGIEWAATRHVALLANVDRSFRTPNLDDLTSRQQAGSGFQFENPNLAPETATTLEAGLRIGGAALEADLWTYRAVVDDAIARAAREASDCPPETPQCVGSWSRYQLVNLDGAATIVGAEASARAWLPRRVDLRASIAWARGEGGNPQEPPSDPALAYDERVPLSRIPPLNGTVEARWGFRPRWNVGAALRWALAQSRLAPSDRTDARIPEGGTPGFATLDLRAGYRRGRDLSVSLVGENVLDAAYRYHGSSINGPGRGLVLQVEGGFDGM
ncbi:MAG: TonB-dependent receptor [Myxococcota bacterium]